MEAVSSQVSAIQFSPEALLFLSTCRGTFSSYMDWKVTVGSTGRPSSRTVVFRGFQEDGDKILINTVSRSQKVVPFRTNFYIEDLKHYLFAETRGSNFALMEELISLMDQILTR